MDCIENNEYSKLELLNQYINGSINDDSQILFEKYRKEIVRSLKLVEVLSLDIPNFMEVYDFVLKKTKGDIKELLEKFKKHIYFMELDNVTKLILKK